MDISYELNLGLHDLASEFEIGNYLFGAVRLTKKVDKNKYEYSGHGNGFDARSSLLLSNRNEFGKNVISFGVNNSLLVHADNKEHFFSEKVQ